MAVRAPVGLHVTWPNMRPQRGFFGPQQSDEEQGKARDAAINAIRNAFDDARAYEKARAAEGSAGVPKHDADVKWDAMRRVVRGEIPVYFHADNAAQIRAIVDFIDQQKLAPSVLVGRRAAWRFAEHLK